MAKSIYKNFETKPEIQVYELSLAKDFAPQEEAIEIEDTGTSYTGPTVDDLKLEAEAFKKKFEIEKQTLLSQAQAEAEKIIRDAEKAAFNEVKKQTDDAQVINQKAVDNASKIVRDAEKKAQSSI